METPGWYKTYAGRGGPTLRANPALHVQGTTARILPPNASGTAAVISAPTKSEKSGVSFSVVSRAIPDADGPPYDGVTAIAEKRSAQKRRGTSNCFMSPFYRTAPITQSSRKIFPSSPCRVLGTKKLALVLQHERLVSFVSYRRERRCFSVGSKSVSTSSAVASSCVAAIGTSVATR